jgi:hypothetical protein
LSRAFEQTLTVDALHDKIDDADSALRPWPSINFIEAQGHEHRSALGRRAGSDQSHGRDQSLALWRCVCECGQIIVAAGARQGLCEV